MKLCPGGKEGAVGIQALPPHRSRVHARLCARQSIHGYRAFKYTQGRVHIDERGGQGEEKVPAKFEARCASESVLRIPGQSSGCALTARNPAAFSPSPGVCRDDKRPTPCFKQLQWDCDGNPRPYRNLRLIRPFSLRTLLRSIAETRLIPTIMLNNRASSR